MKYITKNYLERQFLRFYEKVRKVFAKQTQVSELTTDVNNLQRDLQEESTSTGKTIQGIQSTMGQMSNELLDLKTNFHNLANSDDITLDQLAEIVAYIKNNKSLIDSITTSKVSVSSIVDNLTSTATNKPLSAKQGKVLKELADGKANSSQVSELTTDVNNLQRDLQEESTSTGKTIQGIQSTMGQMSNELLDLKTNFHNLANSDDITLDQLAEIVAYIKNNKSLIDSITTSKVSVSSIVDNLTSTATNKPLSAKQGKVLKELADGKANSSHTHNYAGASSAGGSANSAIKLKEYNNRPTSANLATASEDRLGTMEYFLASNKMTVGKPKDDGHIIQLNWDNTGGYDSQIAIINGKDKSCLQHRGMSAGTWGNWRTVLDSSNYTDYTANYEEGTWTPTIGYTGSSNYTLSNGKYIKIGKIVHCIADVTGKAIANEKIYINTSSLPFVINKYIHGVLADNHGSQPVELFHVGVVSSLTTVKSISFAANLPLYVAFSYTIN